LNIPLPEFEDHLSELDPDRDHIFYCRSGRRSQMAASLAADSLLPPSSAIYNLHGGISAWTGVTLPDYPRVEVFDPQASIQDILMRAMDMEKGAYRFYQQVARMWSGTDFSSIQDMERTHARSVYTLLSKHYGVEESFEHLFDGLEGQTVEGGRSLQDMLEGLQAYDQGGCLALAEVALEIESSAYDLYRHLADIMTDPDMVKEVLILAEQEKGHMRIVAKKIPECVPGN
jgi:rubrerythrin